MKTQAALASPTAASRESTRREGTGSDAIEREKDRERAANPSSCKRRAHSNRSGERARVMDEGRRGAGRMRLLPVRLRVRLLRLVSPPSRFVSRPTDHDRTRSASSCTTQKDDVTCLRLGGSPAYPAVTLKPAIGRPSK